MAWIKSHPHLLVLILVALGALAGSAFVLKSAQDFDHNFDVVRQQPTKGTKVPKQETTALEEAVAEFQKPAVWTVPASDKSIFVSKAYMVENDKLVEPKKGANQFDSFTGKPIPNDWFYDNTLSPFKKGVTFEDPDLDSFWNEDEWRANTKPGVKDSHPPYISKLFFVKYHKISFFLSFKSVNGDAKRPESLDFQINTTAMGPRNSKFLKLGDPVPDTKFKLSKFEEKKVVDGNGIEKDLSELTLTHTETGATIVLVLNKPTDSPDSIAQFQFLWPDPYKPLPISIRKSKDFELPPEKGVKYIVLDIDDTKAVIQLPSGEKLDILPTPVNYPPKR